MTSLLVLEHFFCVQNFIMGLLSGLLLTASLKGRYHSTQLVPISQSMRLLFASFRVKEEVTCCLKCQ